MKILAAAFVLLLITLNACSFEEPQIELFSPEAFAYTLDEGWEVNASVGARGFQQNEENDVYKTSLSYLVDMITPSDTIKNVDKGVVEENASEELLDIMIEAQFELNKEFEEGEYFLIFYVEDNFSKTKDTANVRFNLTWE